MALICTGTMTQSSTIDGWVSYCSSAWAVDDSGLAVLTYAESGQLIGATALLFSVAFIIRAVLRHLGH